MSLSVTAETIVEAAKQLICYGPAYLIIPIFTLGEVDVEPSPLRAFVKSGLYSSIFMA